MTSGMSLLLPFDDDVNNDDRSFQPTIANNNWFDTSSNARDPFESSNIANSTSNLLESLVCDPFSNRSSPVDPFSQNSSSIQPGNNHQKKVQDRLSVPKPSSSSKTRFGDDPFAPIPIDAFSCGRVPPPPPPSPPKPASAVGRAVESKILAKSAPCCSYSSSSSSLSPSDRIRQLEQQLVEIERNFGDMLEHSSAQAWSIVEDQRQQIDELQDRLRSSHRDLLQKEGQLLCVICQDRTRATVFLPCRHCCVCRECAQLKQRACALCKQRIQSILEIYLT